MGGVFSFGVDKDRLEMCVIRIGLFFGVFCAVYMNLLFLIVRNYKCLIEVNLFIVLGFFFLFDVLYGMCYLYN